MTREGDSYNTNHYDYDNTPKTTRSFDHLRTKVPMESETPTP